LAELIPVGLLQSGNGSLEEFFMAALHPPDRLSHRYLSNRLGILIGYLHLDTDRGGTELIVEMLHFFHPPGFDEVHVA
jgi:hypothetical protein